MNKLKSLRKERGLTQKEIADYLNTARSTYTQYELGQREPDILVFKKLADFYNVSLDYLLDFKKFKNASQNTNYEDTKQMIIEELAPGVEVHFEDASKVTREQLKAMKAVWESLKAEKNRNKDK